MLRKRDDGSALVIFSPSLSCVSVAVERKKGGEKDGDEESSTKYNFDSHAKQDVASRQFFNFNYIVLLFPPFWKKKKKMARFICIS